MEYTYTLLSTLSKMHNKFTSKISILKNAKVWTLKSMDSQKCKSMDSQKCKSMDSQKCKSMDSQKIRYNYRKGLTMYDISVIGLDKLIQNLDNFVKYNAQASSRALNRIANTASTLAIRKTVDKDGDAWNIKIGDMKKTIKGSKKSTVVTQEYIFIMTSRALYLDNFVRDMNKSYRGLRTPTGKKRSLSKVGVKYKIKKSLGTKSLAKSFIKSSKFDGGVDRVFTRRPSPTGNSNITAQASITPTSMFKQEGYEVFIEYVQSKFADRYFHELDHLGAFKK